MKVYRYEHPEHEGKGPYSIYYWDQWAELRNELCKDHNVDSHPSFYQDDCDPGWGASAETWMAGCDSLEKLEWWFTHPKDWRPILEAHGFVLMEYEVEERFTVPGKSDKQLIFDRSQATNVASVY